MQRAVLSILAALPLAVALLPGPACSSGQAPGGPPPPAVPLEAPGPLLCDPDRIDREVPKQQLPTSDRLAEVLRRVTPRLREELKIRGLCLGEPIFIRIFKQERRLELWVRHQRTYTRFRDYRICRFSGELGPKTREGDLQAPEGLYQVGPAQMNPNSDFHLSFNLGYPNRYERAKGWTGSALMVHGSCVSIGCYAMTDEGIEEIYTLAHHALRHTQTTIPVHSFPFELSADNLEARRESGAYDFWRELKPAYDRFELQRVPPEVRVVQGRYVVR